jgi:hypothetical protein
MKQDSQLRVRCQVTSIRLTYGDRKCNLEASLKQMPPKLKAIESRAETVKAYRETIEEDLKYRLAARVPCHSPQSVHWHRDGKVDFRQARQSTCLVQTVEKLQEKFLSIDHY